MANKEHIGPMISALASMNLKWWNRWRMEHPEILPDLLGAELRDVDLSYANLSRADLSHADLNGSNLRHANLQKTDLSGTSLRNVNLSEADLSQAILRNADLTGAVLRDAVLRGTNLQGANFDDADLRGADLDGADLAGALIDLDAVRRPRNWFSEGMSRLERLALVFLRQKQVRKGRTASTYAQLTRPRP